ADGQPGRDLVHHGQDDVRSERRADPRRADASGATPDPVADGLDLGHGHADDRRLLGRHGVHDPDPHRRPPGDAQRALRGGEGRRRLGVAAPAIHHFTPPRPGDGHRGPDPLARRLQGRGHHRDRDRPRSGPTDRVADAARLRPGGEKRRRVLRGRRRLRPGDHHDDFYEPLLAGDAPGGPPGDRRRMMSMRSAALIKGVVVYGILFGWTAWLAFPLYWLVIAAFKPPLAVSAGATYLPFVDFTPTLKAFNTIFLGGMGSTDPSIPFSNSIIISFGSSFIALIIGAM